MIRTHLMLSTQTGMTNTLWYPAPHTWVVIRTMIHTHLILLEIRPGQVYNKVCVYY